MQATVSSLAADTPDPTLSALDALVLDLAMARGLDEVMAVVRRNARGLTGADGISFVLRENGRCYYADEDAITPLWKGQRFPMEACISGWAMQHGEVVVIEDIYADDRIPHAAYRPTFVRSLVMVPVRQDDPVAAIGAYWARRHRPQPDVIRALRRIANSASVAMTNIALVNSLSAALEEAERAKDAIILAMASLAETRDNETANHVRRTQYYLRALAEGARERGLFSEELNDATLELLFKSAPLHDIGKVGIPDSILLKPGKLDEEERAVMQTHAELGRLAIANAERHLGASSSFLRLAKEIAYTHHERWDGAGYPQGLAGLAIPLAGRLMAIADVYDALVTERVYKPAMTHDEAVAVVLSERGRQFDPRLVDVFIAIAPLFGEIHSRFADAR
ncbi:HD-GYP domain-containing protein [Bosea sp. TAF32]|uniref:HD-GYP domain-containing protein n=1 Tax=Bosea sp. TAF32 TaxID=3237482 RepID=UPI003F9329F8